MEETDNIQIMGKEELIKAVIEKHERLIAGYSEEFNQIGAIIDTRSRESDLKKNVERDVTDKEVFEEKKHLYADKVIKELEAIKGSLGDIKQPDVDNTKKDIDSIVEKIKAFVSVKNAELADEKRELYETAAADIKGLVIDNGRAETLQSDLDQAYEAYRKLHEIIEGENLKKAQRAEAAAGRPIGDAKRYEWLDKRILSHKEALAYWKGLA